MGAGKLLRTLPSGQRVAGYNTVLPDTHELATGNYFYQVQTNNGGEMKMMQVAH